MNLTRALSRFAKPIPFTRAATGSYVDGIWQPGNATSTTMQAVVQPTKGEERQLLAEGNRHHAMWTVWSQTEIIEGDVFTIDGQPFVVDVLAPRAEGGFWRAVCIEKGASTDGA